MKSQILDLLELKSWCKEFIPLLKPKTLVFLDGPLGVGKTEWVKTILHQMGYTEVLSPTFSLINEYKKENETLVVYHVDLYRIESSEDLESTGFWDLFSSEKSMVFVEWSEKAQSQDWPMDWDQYQLKIDFCKNESQRLYKLTQRKAIHK